MRRRELLHAVGWIGAACTGVAATGACAARESSALPDLPVPDPRIVCDTILNSHRCAMAMERQQLPLVDPHATRSSDTLGLRLADGSTHRMIDGDCCEGDAVTYQLVGVLGPIESYVVHGQFYEGDAHFVVNRRTGESIIAWGPPVLSPDARRLAAASGDIEAGYNPNGFQIWRVREGGRLESEWEYEPTDWAPQHLEWVGPDTIRFTGYGWCAEAGRSDFCAVEGLLRRDGPDWSVAELRSEAP